MEGNYILLLDNFIATAFIGPLCFRSLTSDHSRLAPTAAGLEPAGSPDVKVAELNRAATLAGLKISGTKAEKMEALADAGYQILMAVKTDRTK